MQWCTTDNVRIFHRKVFVAVPQTLVKDNCNKCLETVQC